jgi:heptose-I-phosphate ethanolaminephosphotransferase
LKLLSEIDRKSFFTKATIIFYPWLLVSIIGWFLIPYTKDYFKEIIAFFLMSLILLGVVVPITKSSFQKYLVYSSFFLLSALAFVKLSFYYHYGVKLSASALFVIFETNAIETSDFLSNYFDKSVMVLCLLFLIPILYFWYTIFFRIGHGLDQIFRQNTSTTVPAKICVIIIIAISAFIIQKKFKEENVIIKSIRTYDDYVVAKKLLKDNLAQKTSPNIEITSFSSDPQTYVVVIGESTSNWHMGLYGYARKTNPLLSEIREELIVFDNVIAPNVHTILALEKALTLSDFEFPNRKNNASIVQLANAAGFTTYWLSNQKPVGVHETVSTIIAYAADHAYYLATDDYRATIYDENLLPTFAKVLEASDKKKMIFLHLIGTHINYSDRYPKEFNVYTRTKPKNKFTDSKGMRFVNSYDNAIRYNDSIIREVIEMVRDTDTKSYVSYFSDHGDEVYDTMELAGHNEYHATRPMYEVPFLIWASEKYQQDMSGSFERNMIKKRRYNLEDYIHSFAELSKIKFAAWDSTKSIFNPGFQSKTRWIKEGEDYDRN